MCVATDRGGALHIGHADNEPREATRLLLLDESYRDKPNDELPQAVQVAISFYCLSFD